MGLKNDMLWKGVLEWVFEDLLRFLFPNADELFDLQKEIVFLDKELAELYPDPENAEGVRFVDKLVRVYRKDGQEEWVLIHIEVQGETKTADRPHFGKRMFQYFYRVFDHYDKPLSAVAIFTGPDGEKLPDCFDYSFLGTHLHYGYRTLRIRDYTDEELTASKNPFAWVILIAKQALLDGKDVDKRLLEGKLFIFRKLYENGLFERRKLQAIFEFLDKYVQFGEKETIRIFRERVDQFTGKTNTMDIFEQVTQMKVKETKEEVVRNLLAVGKLSAQEIATAAGVALADVEKIRKGLRRN